jgi:hypothetical protein
MTEDVAFLEEINIHSKETRKEWRKKEEGEQCDS